jgi:hypothetical protein
VQDGVRQRAKVRKEAHNSETAAALLLTVHLSLAQMRELCLTATSSRPRASHLGTMIGFAPSTRKA